MTKPTPEQIQRACDLANAADPGQKWTALDYGAFGAFIALADTLAELDEATANINLKADVIDRLTNQLAAAEAERDKARADLEEIDALLDGQPPINSSLTDAQAIVAPYRVKTDPLFAQFPALLNILHYHETGGHKGDGSDEALELARKELLNLAKRGLEIGRSA